MIMEHQRRTPIQDILPEWAQVDTLMTICYEEEARQFAEAATDPEIVAELALLEAEFATADRETWPDY
jgi:hypothetical protein